MKPVLTLTEKSLIMIGGFFVIAYIIYWATNISGGLLKSSPFMNNESSWANNNDKPSTMSNQDNKTQNLSLANTSFCDVIADWLTDVGAKINACIINTPSHSKIILPSWRLYIGSTTIQIPLGKHYVTLEWSGIGGATMLVTDKNIIAIRAGEYTYTSQTDPTPPVSFNIYGVNIKNITIVNNYSGSAKKAIGIDLRGLHNSNIDWISCDGVTDCIVVNPSNHWNVISNIRAYWVWLDNTIRIQGDGYTNNYNSTANIYSHIMWGNVKNAVIYAKGCAFGDAVMSDIQGVGISAGGYGVNGWAIAAVYLNSNGLNCPDGKTRYASRITINGVDFDGVGDYVVRGTHTYWIRVWAVVKWWAIVNWVSFDAQSVESYQTFFTDPRLFTMDTLGNIGISTTVPSAKLTIQQTGDAFGWGVRIIKTWWLVNGYWDQWISSWNYLNFGWLWSSGGTMMTIGSNGNIGIWTPKPKEKLHVVGSVLATWFLTSSDKNLKKNITWLSGSLEKIISLNGYSYNWKSNGIKDIGVIAQEVEKIFPMLVHTDGEGIKSVEYGNLIAPLIEAIKELNANNISQSEEITSLKSEISEMKAAIKLLMKEQK